MSTCAGNAAPSQRRLKSDDPTEQVETERGAQRYPMTVGTENGTLEHSRTDCVCVCNVGPSGAVNL
jgi:hypothetical protein